MKLIQIIIGFIFSIPVALADSVFTNPAFDTVLLLIVAGVFFFLIRAQIQKIGK